MGYKRATLKDIAKLAGVSPRAVSMVLNEQGRISRETRKRVMEIAGELNYQPNMMAKGLRKKKTFLIAAVFPYISVSFFNRILKGLEERCAQHRYDLLIGNSTINYASSAPSEEQIDDNSEVLRRMINRNVDGIICSPHPKMHGVFDEIIQKGTPLIQLMTRIPGLNLPFVGVDNERGGYLAARHLIDLGHRNIGFLSSIYREYEEVQLRYRGYLRALIQKGITLDTEDYEEACDLTVGGSAEAVKRLLGRRPETTAIFAATDYAALGAIRGCLELGLRVPEDISVVGYDDLDIARFQLLYPLSTVAQPKEEIGWAGFDALNRLIDGESDVQDHYLEPELMVRRTSAVLSVEEGCFSENP